MVPCLVACVKKEVEQDFWSNNVRVGCRYLETNPIGYKVYPVQKNLKGACERSEAEYRGRVLNVACVNEFAEDSAADTLYYQLNESLVRQQR